MKRIVALLILVAFSATAFAQTKREWLKYADAAFKNGDYKNAVTFYVKVIDKNTPFDITHPYAVKPYITPRKNDTAASGFKIFNITIATPKLPKKSARQPCNGNRLCKNSGGGKY